MLLDVNPGYSNEPAKTIKAANGYVSNVVEANEDEDRMQWEKTAPATVKCRPRIRPSYHGKNNLSSTSRCSRRYRELGDGKFLDS